jgi:hypothetical protein
VPGLMLSLLRDDGWRRLVRPIDGKEFVNDTVEQWVRGEPWAGLHFPSWDALYAMLDRSEHGPECRERLIVLGAPANGAAADAPVARSKPGRPPKESTKFVDISTGGTDRSVARLKRDHPALAEEVIAGRISAHAAAVQAGFRKPTWTAPADPERLAQAIDKRLPGWRLARATDPDTGPSRPEAQAHAPDRVSPIPSVATDADLAVTVYGDPSSWPVRLQGPLQRAVEDCGWFAHLARQLKLCASWRQVAPDWSLFCEQKLGHPAPFVDAVIAGAQALGEKVDPSGDAQYRADAATLPARGRARLEKLEAQLRAMFDDEVQRRVQQELRERHRELVAQLEAERDAYIKKHLAAATMKASMHAILSESDYRLLLSVRPSHESRSKSSLAIRELPDGRVLVRDFGGCDVEDVLGAVGLTFADLYPETIDTSREAGGDRRYRSRERLPFDAGALLRALHADVLMAATIVSRMLDNNAIDDAERDALWRCAGRLAEAVEALDGRC